MTMYEQARKKIYDEIEIEDRMLLKKKKERLEGSRDKGQNLKPEHRMGRRDAQKLDPRPI